MEGRGACRSARGDQLGDGTAVPLGGSASIVPLMHVSCERGGRSLSVFHVSSQQDEQRSSWT
ncbi:hypothetical protein EYF80_035148 [Liparis tanakae]|uniref:Uncharacterized protein n=1 Tax=Liparis tanakae TaxID=230148 RepID=A0A4Z2GMC7_9TELE|nr:hypothetical protein EYF80_035148 [Liparis tanakae]